MPVSDFRSLMLPALVAFAAGLGSSLSEFRERIVGSEGRSAGDARELLPGVRKAMLANRVNWAAIHKECASLTERVRHGMYWLTQDCQSRLARPPSRIDIHLLQRCPDRARCSERENAPPSGGETTEIQRPDQSATPEEALDRAVRQLSG